MSVDDLVAHELGSGCACGPVSIPIVTGEGERFHLTSHRRIVGPPTAPRREDLPVAVPPTAPKLVDRKDGRNWLVAGIFTVALLLNLALM